MPIQAGTAASPSPQFNTVAAADAAKTAPQKIADARAEANAGITDGDENPSTGTKVNRLA